MFGIEVAEVDGVCCHARAAALKRCGCVVLKDPDSEWSGFTKLQVENFHHKLRKSTMRNMPEAASKSIGNNFLSNSLPDRNDEHGTISGS